MHTDLPTAKRFRTIFLLLLTTCSLLPHARGETPAEERSVQLKTVFDKHLVEIHAEGSNRVVAVHGQYLQALVGLQKRIRAQGDLAGVKAVTAERKRFAESNAAHDAPDEIENDDLRKLAGQLEKALKQSEHARCSKIVELAAKYKAALEQAVAAQVRAGEMEAANRLDACIGALAQLPTVTAAQFYLEMEAAPPDAPGGDSGATGETATAGNASEAGSAAAQAAPPPADNQVKGDGKIYPGRNAPRVAGVVFRRQSLANTGHVGLSDATASATLELATDNNASRSSSGYTTYGNEAHKLRAYLRPRQSGSTLKDLHALVQVYARPAGKNMGRTITPRQHALMVLPVPELNSQGVTCAFTPVAIRKSSSRSYSRGSEYYGTLLSIFDSEGKMLYQGATKPNLNVFGSNAPGLFEKYQKSGRIEILRERYDAARQAYYGAMGNPDLREAYLAARAAYNQALSRRNSP